MEERVTVVATEVPRKSQVPFSNAPPMPRATTKHEKQLSVVRFQFQRPQPHGAMEETGHRSRDGSRRGGFQGHFRSSGGSDAGGASSVAADKYVSVAEGER